MSTESAGVEGSEDRFAPPRPKIFYGWWIVLAGFTMWTFNGMVLSYGLSVFYKRLIDDFGWSRAQLAGAARGPVSALHFTHASWYRGRRLTMERPHAGDGARKVAPAPDHAH